LPGLQGRDPKEVFDEFRDYLASVLNKTVTDARLSLVHARNSDRAELSFRKSEASICAPVLAPDLFLYIGQILRVTQQPDRSWRLRTVQYRYRIQGTDNPNDEECLRWEYVAREVRDAGHCRHHLHLQGEYTLGPRRSIGLADAHIPTGWVTIEEIIRFLITDLAVRPKEAQWEQLLRDSEEQFRSWTGRDV
jgi:hypothetical protein